MRSRASPPPSSVATTMKWPVSPEADDVDPKRSKVEIPVRKVFDVADGDILGECCVTHAGYAHMTYMLSTLAGGKVVVALQVSLSVKRCSFELNPYGYRENTRSNHSPTALWLLVRCC